jgi:hypothetical protein
MHAIFFVATVSLLLCTRGFAAQKHIFAALPQNKDRKKCSLAQLYCFYLDFYCKVFLSWSRIRMHFFTIFVLRQSLKEVFLCGKSARIKAVAAQPQRRS